MAKRQKIAASIGALFCVAAFQNCQDFSSVQQASARTPSSIVTNGRLGPTEIELAAHDVSVSPGDVAKIEILLEQSTPHDITFTYSTVDSSAIAGKHYQAAHGTGIIREGSSSAVILVPTLKDAGVDYRNHDFKVELASNSYRNTVRVRFSKEL